VTLTGIAVVPAAPALIPAVAAGAAGDLAATRDAALEAVAALLATQPDLVVLLGAADPGSPTAAYGPGDSGTVEGFGVDLRVPLGARICAGEPVAATAVTVAAWLLHQVGFAGDVQGFALADVEPGPDGPIDRVAERATAVAAELRDLPGRVALLVAADGSACRTPKAPGSFDPRAEAFDTQLAEALAAGDPARLPADPVLARELWCRAVPMWQLLRALNPAVGRARVLHADAPYGVGYVVGTWLPDGAGVSATLGA
jgi:hypothetical protein